MEIRGEDHSLSINNTTVTLKQTTTGHYLEALNSNYRTVALDFGVTILIFDEIGIRAWTRENIIYELEVLLIKDSQSDLKSPQEIYQGEIYLSGHKLSAPYLVNDILAQTDIHVAKDDDSFRYALNILKSNPNQEPGFSFWCNDNFLQVSSIRFN